uniref:Ceramide kinase-like n=1 Tax=Oncorhynchus kisutch TaxID=8019 RepID=A0A8C7CYD4_ONCKI
MFESPRKSINEGDALSKSQEELSETPPGSPVNEPIVRGIFQIRKKSHDVLLPSTRVTWSLIQPETPTGELTSETLRRTEYVQLKDMFEVKVKRDATSQQTGGTLLGITLFQFKKNGPKLKDHAIHFNNMNVEHCEIWFKKMKEILRGNASLSTLRQQFVADLCVCCVSYMCVFSRVVAFGGDGSVAEMAHGLLLQAQMESGRDTDSMFTPVQAPLPLGLIPAGEEQGWQRTHTTTKTYTHTHMRKHTRMHTHTPAGEEQGWLDLSVLQLFSILTQYLEQLISGY